MNQRKILHRFIKGSGVNLMTFIAKKILGCKDLKTFWNCYGKQNTIFHNRSLVLPFLKPFSVRFTCMNRVLTHQHFPNKIGHNTLGTNEADQYNEIPFLFLHRYQQREIHRGRLCLVNFVKVLFSGQCRWSQGLCICRN